MGGGTDKEGKEGRGMVRVVDDVVFSAKLSILLV